MQLIRRVLVVDDCKDAAESLAILLRLWGHDVVCVAHDGPEALEAARRQRPEMVFLDIGMPGMTGYELARHLRALDGGREFFLIAVTGYGRAEDRQRSRESGIDCHLLKPCSPDGLRRLLTQTRDEFLASLANVPPSAASPALPPSQLAGFTVVGLQWRNLAGG
jgi:CheY-like chemotaxis protein